MKILHFIIIILPLLSSTGLAQNIFHVKGTSQVKVENNMTKEQAKEKAEDLAIINAIENTFGTYVGQEGNTVVADGKITYNIIGLTKVKGEWIGTKDIEFKDDIRKIQGSKETETWITCTIEGDARKIRSLSNLKAKTLRCPQIECETDVFLSSQMLYLYFSSPIDGYLSIYNEEEDGITRRLLPYLSQGSLSNVKVKGDENYIFFSTDKHLNKFNVVVDPMELFTDRSVEFNTLYIVFSPNDYVKSFLSEAVPQVDKSILPKSLPTKKFQEWLSDSQADSPEFQVKRLKIRISKNN
jgi:hypothetical protein